MENQNPVTGNGFRTMVAAMMIAAFLALAGIAGWRGLVAKRTFAKPAEAALSALGYPGREVDQRSVVVLPAQVVDFALPKLANAVPEALTSEAAALAQWVKGARWVSSSFAMTADSATGIFALTAIQAKGGRFRPTGSIKVSPPLMVVIGHLNRFWQDAPFSDQARISFAVLQEAAGSPASLQTVRMILNTAKDDKTTELGGLLTLSEGEAPRIHLHPVADREAGFVQEMRKTREDFNAVFSLLEKNPEHFFHLEFEYRRVLDQLPRLDTSEKRRKRLDMFLDLYFFMATHTYLPDDKDFVRVVVQGVEGRFIGLFHTHPPDNPPSLEDRLFSINLRNFVLTPGEDGYTLYEVLPGLEKDLPSAKFRWPM